MKRAGKHNRHLSGWCLPLAAIGALPFATPAHAQSETLIVQPSLPEDFDRGRNVGVGQRSRPDYDPVGVRAGSFEIFPQIGLAAGYSNNIFYSGTDKTRGGFLMASPSVRARSDWSRHGLDFRAGTDIQRYFSHSRRNQTPWEVMAQGQLDLNELKLIPEAQIARQYENPLSGETSSDAVVLSNYLRKYAGLRGEYLSGRGKVTVAVDDTNYAFNDIRFQSGAVIDQSDRDRNIFRTTAQYQYAFTPSIATYVRMGYARTVYDRALLSGDSNRDSKGYQMLAGFNFDLAGFMRGTIGAGYTRRNFDSPLYRDVDGLSFEGKLEYFPSELTTVTLALRRVIEDSNIASTTAFFDNRIRLSVDHELRRNIILSPFGEYARQSYIGTSSRFNAYRFGTNARFLASNWLRFNLNLAYTGRSDGGALIDQKFNELRGQVGITLMR